MLLATVCGAIGLLRDLGESFCFRWQAWISADDLHPVGVDPGR